MKEHGIDWAVKELKAGRSIRPVTYIPDGIDTFGREPANHKDYVGMYKNGKLIGVIQYATFIRRYSIAKFCIIKIISDSIPSALTVPMNWEQEGFHPWTSYITDELKSIWDTFNDEQKKAIANYIHDKIIGEVERRYGADL